MSGKYETQVQASCYDKHAFHPLRIESITEQLRILSYYNCRNILEIGVGKGLLKHFLIPFPEITHTSIDIAEDLHPDYVGSVTNMPFSDNAFDVAICCQVLEHLPFEMFETGMKELYRVTEDLAIVSLPDKRRRFGLGACFCRYGWKLLEVNFERSKVTRAPLGSEHFWEIGHGGVSYKNVKDCIQKSGFEVLQCYRLLKQEWHCVFVLRK
ncbi:MAG: class I SAM-dependent methyltransferase [Phycisphaerae bacterium]|nr:class I SAM-dependent methyltransferase [Phycisphaerae bacterium]